MDPFTRNKDGSKGKFIGGAAQARRMAKQFPQKKRKATRILRPGEAQAQSQALPKGLGSYERYFASLLRSGAADFVSSSSSSKNSHHVWEAACRRLRLPVLTAGVKPQYTDPKEHFAVRASLILEESRHLIAEALSQWQAQQRQHKQRNNRHSHSYNNDSEDNQQRRTKHKKPQRPSKIATKEGDCISVVCEEVSYKDRTGHTLLSFSKNESSSSSSDGGTPQHLTKDELSGLRPATVVACIKSERLDQVLRSSVNDLILGCVLPTNRETLLETATFSVQVFQKLLPAQTESTRWTILPLVSLLSEHRKFEACFEHISNYSKLPFLYPLLGMKRSTHTRFDHNDEADSSDDESSSSSSSSSGSSSSSSDDSDSDSDDDTMDITTDNLFRLSTLNPGQEKAASSWLASPRNTISLVQGPPGTGKTTLLVNVLCRYLLQSISEQKERTIMVCAPTNKAISVLCTRFLDSFTGHSNQFINVMLVGDDDKLLDEEDSQKGGSMDSCKLRSIFLYTWTRTLLEEYSKIQKALSNDRFRDLQGILDLAVRLEQRLRHNLPGLPKATLQLAKEIAVVFKSMKRSGWKVASRTQASDLVQRLSSAIRDWKKESVWNQLLGSAHVIFCTLASAGTSVLKKSSIVVDDLIVDEAAAATEPEMYIPFYFYPKRLLAVGDPKQLPATIMSQRADSLGLSKSMHERLMNELGVDHIMLDIQYRMKPAISVFPSTKFYGGKLRDGPNVISATYQSRVRILGGRDYSFLQVEGKERQGSSGSYENESEARAVVDLVQQLRNASSKLDGRWDSVSRVRIITFYQAQVTLLKRLLSRVWAGNVVVATVDSSQGCEADLVIISCVRSNGEAQQRTVGFLNDDRRLNVSLTRAKHQLIIVGNAKSMSHMKDDLTVCQLAKDAFRRNCVVKQTSRGIETLTYDENAHKTLPSTCPEESQRAGQRAKRDLQSAPEKGRKEAKRPRSGSFESTTSLKPLQVLKPIESEAPHRQNTTAEHKVTKTDASLRQTPEEANSSASSSSSSSSSSSVGTTSSEEEDEEDTVEDKQMIAQNTEEQQSVLVETPNPSRDSPHQREQEESSHAGVDGSSGEESPLLRRLPSNLFPRPKYSGKENNGHENVDRLTSTVTEDKGSTKMTVVGATNEDSKTSSSFTLADVVGSSEHPISLEDSSSSASDESSACDDLNGTEGRGRAKEAVTEESSTKSQAEESKIVRTSGNNEAHDYVDLTLDDDGDEDDDDPRLVSAMGGIGGFIYDGL